MGEFTATVQQRLKEAYASLRAARAADDQYLTDLQLAEIEGLQRIATEHGVPIPCAG